MPFDGSGNYTPPTAPAFPAVTGQTIVAAYYNSVVNDLAVAISNCITRDGQGKPSAGINWNGQNLSNVGALSAASLTLSGGLSVTNLTVTGTTDDTGGGIIANGTLFVDTTVPISFSANNNSVGQAGYHIYNGGGAAEWLIYQPAHATADDFRISKLVGGVVTDYFKVATTGAITIVSSLAAASLVLTAPLPVTSGGTGATTSTGNGSLVLSNSPTFSGTPTAPTATFADNSTTIASTAFVQAAKAAAVQVITSSGTITPVSTNDMVTVSALAVATNIANVSGTPTEGWGLVIRIKDNGTARAITYGTGYRGIGLTLPATTVASKWLYLGMVWNATDSTYDVLSAIQQ